MRLSEKTAIVTGGASGIGRATTELFGREGAKIAVVDWTVEAALETVAQIQKDGGEATPGGRF